MLDDVHCGNFQFWKCCLVSRKLLWKIVSKAWSVLQFLLDISLMRRIEYMCNAKNASDGLSIQQVTENQFVVKEEEKIYRVCTDNGGKCQCGEFTIKKLPCPHLLGVLVWNRMDIMNYCCPSWTNDTAKRAYREFSTPNNITLMRDFSEPPDNGILPPTGIKKTGRPKKRRIESQGATTSLNKSTRNTLFETMI